MDYLYILDYSDCTICEIDVSNEEDDDVERILKKYGCNIDTCAYMYSQNKINTITELTELNYETIN